MPFAAGTNTELICWPPKKSYFLDLKYAALRIGLDSGKRYAWSMPIFQAAWEVPKSSRATSVASLGCLVCEVTEKLEPPQSPWAPAPAVHCGSGATRHLPEVFAATLER